MGKGLSTTIYPKRAPDSDILKFYQDSKGQLWCYTVNGKLGVIYAGQVHHQTMQGYPLKSLNSQIYDIIEYDNKIFVCILSGMYQVTANGFREIHSFQRPHFMKFNDQLLIITIDSVFRYDRGQFNLVTETPHTDRDPKSHIATIDSSWYSYTPNTFKEYTLLEYNLDGSYQQKALPFQIYNVKILDNTLYMFTSEGVYQKSGQHVNKVLDIPIATNLLMDKSQNQWITTYGNGVKRLTPINRMVKMHDHPSGFERVICSDQNVYVIGKTRDTVWRMKGYEDLEVLHTGSRIRDLEELPNGQVTISSEYTNNKIFLDLPNDSILVANGRHMVELYEIHEDSISVNQRVDLPNFNLIKYTIKLDQESLEFINRRGIYRCNIRPPFTTTVVFDIVVPTHAFYNQEDLWVATNGAGIWVLSESDTTRITREENGLSSNYASKILKNENKVWALTASSVDIIQLVDGRIGDVNRVPEMNVKVNDIALFKDQVVMATDDGLYSFRQQEMFVEQSLPKFVIESCISGNEDTPLKDSLLVVNSGVKGFDLTYSTLSLASPLPISYRYRMVSLEAEDPVGWVYTNENQLIMSNLKAASYQLEIQYRHQNMPWTTGASIQVEVLPVWWETLWFRVLLILIASGVITLVSFGVLNFLRARKRQRSEKLFAELRSRKAQLKPHFVFNALNSIRNFMLINDVQKSDSYLTAYSRLMRKVLDLSDQLLIRLSDELDLVRLYLSLEQLRLGHSFDYLVQVADGLDASQLKFPAMITQPFIENAVWHGLREVETGGELLVRVEEINSQIGITIKDNGVGFDLSDQKTNSYGMLIINDKIRLMKETYEFDIQLSVQSRLGEGTEVLITIPKLM